MAILTLQQIFGASASETSDSIVISKSDLSTNAPGYSPTTANDAQSSLAALIIQAYNLGLDANHRDGSSTLNITANPNQKIAFTLASYPTYVSRANAAGTFITDARSTFTVDLDTPFSNANINPNNYAGSV